MVFSHEASAESRLSRRLRLCRPGMAVNHDVEQFGARLPMGTGSVLIDNQ
jgi:hypothetical protein